MNLVRRRNAFSLMELMAVLAIVGLLATVIVPRVLDGGDSAKVSACHTYKGDIEIQAELWMYHTGSWPVGDLSDIGADLNYFPRACLPAQSTGPPTRSTPQRAAHLVITIKEKKS